MHELSLCGAIVDTVTEAAEGRPVASVNLSIGHFRQIVPDTLRFCWDMRVKDSALDGCNLNITEVAAVIECADCGTDTTLEHPILRCASCSSTNVTMTSGEEFLIESIEIDTAQTTREHNNTH